MRTSIQKLSARLIVGGFAVTTGLVLFQNCSGDFAALTQGAASLSSSSRLSGITLPRIASRFSFSNGFTGPSSRQGTGEGRTAMSAAAADARYAKIKSWGSGYRQYNFWWGEVDNSGQASTTGPQACPAAFQLVPASEAERVAKGFHRFRCINKAKLASWDDLFSRDQAAGMQSGVVMWSAPPQYRHPNCIGFDFAGNFLKDGCVPRAEAMDDFEDYANLIASRYNGSGVGKVSHYIVWNENGSPDWFDYTPYVGKTDGSAAAFEARIDKLADMMKRVHAALARHQTNALMYVSTDQLWAPNLSPAHMGTRWLLDGLWARLGTDYSWSVAVHPYGEVDSAAPANLYTFNNLEMVSNHQAQRLQERGITDPYSYPQTRLIASEQGWPIQSAMGAAGVMGRETQARQMCLAHAKISSMPQVVAVAHNYFHSAEVGEDQAGGSSGQGAFFGLIPVDIPDSLGGAEFKPTGRAFASTMNASRWNQANDHYCCQVYGLGCAGSSNAVTGVPTVVSTHQIMGSIDGVSGNVLQGWACARTMDRSIAVHVYIGGAAGQGGTGAATAIANVAAEPGVSASCVAGASNFRFSIPLDNGFRAAYAGRRIFVHGISPIGLDNSLLTRSGEHLVPAADPVAPTPGAPDLAAYPRVTIHRLYKNADHLLTTTQSEGLGQGYVYEGAAFTLIRPEVNDSRLRAIYRCFAANHFLSVDPNCEGNTNEGMIGKSMDQAYPGGRLLYRFFHPQSGDHLITVSPSEAVGFNQESTMGYAY